MLMTLGVFILFVGGLLFTISIPRLILANGNAAANYIYPLALLAGGILCIGCSIVFISYAQHDEIAGMVLGLPLFFMGMILLALGVWMTFWGTLSDRNRRNGTMFMVSGLLCFLIAIILMFIDFSHTHLAEFQLPHMVNISKHWSSIAWNRPVASIPFSVFVIAMFLLSNAIAIYKQHPIRRIVAANLILTALCMLLYFTLA